MNSTYQNIEFKIQSTAYEPTFHKYQAMADDGLSYKISYRRNLPHIQPAGASFFVTFRLAGSLPVTVLRALKAEADEQEQALGREGQFWQRESYDHIVRDRDEYLRIRRYILNNPVKAGLVDHWTEWPYSYCTS